MQKWVWMIMILAMAVSPTLCPAAYLIQMENGTSFITDEYWEEDGQVKFNHYGGIMGVSKKMIAAITDSDAPVPEEIIQTDVFVTVYQTGTSLASEASISNNQSTANDNVNQTNDPDFEKKVERYKSDQLRIIDAMITQKMYFDTAKEQGDNPSKDEAWKRIIDIDKEKASLRQEVRGLYNGTLPEWWDEAEK